MKRNWLHVLALSLVTALPVQADPFVDLVWQSQAETDDALAQEIQSLYLALYNSGTMKVRKVTLGDRLVEQLLRDEDVFFGAHFPVGIDALLCDLNPDLCSRQRQSVSPQILTELAAHVGGFEPTYGSWRTSADSVITIPDYRFESETTLSRVPVEGDWSPSQYIASADTDCSAWGKSCADVVKSFNPKQFRSKVTSATLPQARLKTTLTVKIDPTSTYLDVLSGAAVSTRSLQTNDLSSVSDALRAQFEGSASVDLLVEAINPNLMPFGRVSKYSGAQEVNQPLVLSLLQAIHHPYGYGKDIPEIFRGPVKVTVFDTAISEGHCDWKPTHQSSGETMPQDPDPTCDQVKNDLLSDGDHSAFVAGLIAAQPNGHGMVGINPYADVNFLALNTAVSPDMQIEDMTTQLFLKMPLDTEVVNISAGFFKPDVGSTDRLEGAFESLSGNALFVVAAGNENLDLEDDCRIFPACLDRFDNVVTVVGLTGGTAEPAIWKSLTTGSNHSPDFAIGAVAENVYSTVSDNLYAQSSGTSMAAPQVTATASLIVAASKRVWAQELGGARIPPKFIKDRLIYTADVFPGLAGKVKSGRLNVSRAIAVAFDQFTLRDGRTIIGQIQSAPDDFACRTPVAAEQIQKFYNLRRMTYMPESQRFLLWKHDTQDLAARDAPLVLLASCNLTTISPVVTVKVGLNEFAKFEFGDILDYTSRFIETGP